MIVTCPQCKFFNELDDSMVDPRGTVVACIRCGHFFLAWDSASSDVAKSRGWMIRQAGGAVFEAPRLSAVQKWILDGTFTLEDELSRTGKSWIKLGEITELSGIFKLAALEDEERTEKMEKMDTVDMETGRFDVKSYRPDPEWSEPIVVEGAKARDYTGDDDVTAVKPIDLTRIKEDHEAETRVMRRGPAREGGEEENETKEMDTRHMPLPGDSPPDERS